MKRILLLACCCFQVLLASMVTICCGAEVPVPSSKPEKPYPNEPPGLTCITERDFSSLARRDNDRGPGGSQGWDGYESRCPRLTLVRDPTAPKSPPSVAQMLYPAGFEGGVAPATALISLAKAKATRLYLSLWLQLDPSWQGHRSSTNKMFFVNIAGGARFFVSAEGQGSGPLIPQLRMQGTPDGRHRLLPNLEPKAQLKRGAWQRWELLLVANAPGEKNGELHWWIDGKKIHEHKDIMFVRQQESPCWTEFYWRPIWGGGGDAVAKGMTLKWDHVYLSGAK